MHEKDLQTHFPKEVRVVKCLDCGWKWATRTNPKRCPKCKSIYWNEERAKRRDEKADILVEKTSVNALKCLRCGYEWYPRRFEKPKVCPNCSSPYWDKERTI